MKGIPWGKRIEGTVDLQCTRCNHKWEYRLEEDGEIICEVIGLRCPGCNKISGNRVLEWKRLNTLDTWFR